MNMNGNFTFDEKALEEKLKLLKIDYFNIAKVIADTTGKKTKSIVEDMNSRTTLNPTEAKKYGLVHKIQSHLFPSAADLTVIHEDASIFELPATTAPQPVAQPTPVMQIPASMPFTAPKVQGFTEASTLSHGTFFV